MYKKFFETERLILRPWNIDDAESLFKYASDERIGPSAGWPPHKSVDDSEKIIETVLSSYGTYAVVVKENGEAAGSIGIWQTEKNGEMVPHQYEIGFWIGVPFWGKGYIPEAVSELQNYLFSELKAEILWCGYFEGNDKSKRVQEKCGFKYHHTVTEKPVPLLYEVRTEHYLRITSEEYKNLTNKIS